MYVLAAMSGGNPSALTTALIALGGAVIGGLITAGGQLIVERSRAKYETTRETARLEREREAAETEHRQRLVEKAVTAGQRAMTYFESRSRPRPADAHMHAEAVRIALWRLALFLGDDHELVSAYDAVTQAFQSWNEVIIGAAGPPRSGADDPSLSHGLFTTLPYRRPRGGPSSFTDLALVRLGVRTSAWIFAREQTRSRLTAFMEAAHRYLAIESERDRPRSS